LGRTFHFHLQGWKLSEVRSVLHPGFLLVLLFSPEDVDEKVPPKRRLTVSGLHAVISQKIELFITTAVGT
jgi:hypothetical protein